MLTLKPKQATVDFGSISTVAIKGCALEDGSVLVLHQDDLQQNICVLAVEGYGEPDETANKKNGSDRISEDSSTPPNTDSVEYRGARPWRNSIGGATVCCSRCCVTLGTAAAHSPETCRLFKHRLGSSNMRDGGESNQFQQYTCGSFLAGEMLRYSEGQAVFTFVVASRPSLHRKSEGKCLLLKLLSWDTKVLTSGYLRKSEKSSFTRVAKIVFEETDDLGEGSFNALNDDMAMWTWGGIDLCCPPPTKGKDGGMHAGSEIRSGNPQSAAPFPCPKASVRIELFPEDLSDLRSSLLAGSLYFSQAARNIAVSLGLGKEGEIKGGAASLGFLPLRC